VLGIASPTIQAAQLAAASDAQAIDTALAELEQSGSIAPPSTFDEASLNVDSLFDAFKAGMAAQVGEGDSEMQYDLGVAYLEMGQWDDAIEAFQNAVRDPTRAIAGWSMIGTAHQRRRDWEAALQAYGMARRTPGITQDQELGLLYEIGNVFEARGERPRALRCFRRIQKLSADFRDVGDRVHALGRAVAVRERLDSFTDLDEAFGELLSKRGNSGGD